MEPKQKAGETLMDPTTRPVADNPDADPFTQLEEDLEKDLKAEGEGDPANPEAVGTDDTDNDNSNSGGDDDGSPLGDLLSDCD